MPVWVLATNLDMISCEYHMITHPDHMTYSISRDLRCANSALSIPGRTTRERERVWWRLVDGQLTLILLEEVGVSEM